MSKKNSLLGNLSWKFAERIAAQLVTTIVSIILARILDPAHYGVISLVMIFITFANVFVSDGFGSALIQKKNADKLDFSSVLYFNIGFSVVLYLILFFSAPLISDFFGKEYEELTLVFRVLGLRIILTGINSVQQAYVSKNMMFRKFFYATLFGTVLSAIVGIGMAISGFGVWALVAQYLTNTTVDTIVLAISIRKKPLFKFSYSRLKGIIGFGGKVLGTNLLMTGYQELRALIIGKKYSSADLAFYNKGAQFPNMLVANINVSISAVLFPKMSNDQNDREKVKATMKNSIRFSSYFMSPLLIGFAIVAKPFISLLLTDKWLPCVPYLQLICINYLFYAANSANMQAIKALGQGSIYMKLEVVKKLIELSILLITTWISVKAIVIGMVITSVCFVPFNAFPNKKLLNYTLKEQLNDLMSPIIMSLVMALGIIIIGKVIHVNNFILLVIQIVFGGLIYILLSVLTKNKEFNFILNLIKSRFKSGGKNEKI